MEDLNQNPKFTQRHYELLADAIAASPNPTLQHQLTYFLADIFEKDNPKFNRVKFLVRAIPSLKP